MCIFRQHARIMVTLIYEIQNIDMWNLKYVIYLFLVDVQKTLINIL